MSTNKKPIKRGSLKSKCRLKKLQLGGETPFGNQNEFLNLKTPNTNLQTPTYNFGDYSKGKYTNGNTSYNFNDVSTWGDPGTVNLQTDLSTSTTTSNLGSGSMLSFAGSILGDYLDSVDEKNMKPINKLMNDAASNLRYVDIGKIGAESTSFNRGENMENALELDTNIRKQIKVNQGATRVANMTQPNNYAPVAKLGGTIARGGLNIYKGPTHEQVSEDGNTGILVDAQGNPVKMSFANAVAEVEGGGKGKKGEVSWFNKKSGETYVFPVSGAGTAPKAKQIINNYKLNKPNTTYDKDILLTEAVDAQLENLKQATEFSKETGTELKDTLQFAKKGGSLSRWKAGEMLKDGTANGKKLTAKQKRYFGWVYGGKKDLGGSLEEPTKNASVYQTNNIPIRLTQQQAYDRYISKNNPNLDFNKFSKMPLDEQKALSYDPSFSISKGKELESMYKDNAIYQYTRDIKGPTNMLATDGSISMPNVSDAYLLSKGLNPNFKFGGDLPKYDGKSTKNQILPPDEEKYLREIGMTDKQINQIRQNKLNKYLSGLTKEQKRDRRREILNTPKDTYEPIGYGTPYGEVTGDTGFEQRPMNTLDIPAGQVIKGSDEKSKGTGTTFKPTKPTTTSFKVPTSQLQNPNLNKKSYFDTYEANKLRERSYAPEAENYENYTPTLSPLGHGLSAIGSVADYFAMNKALKAGKPEDVKLPRTAAERVSYARQRLINERNAAASRATAAATARATGLNAGSAYANTMAARTGVDRVLGQENMKSLEDEANQNALLAQQANMLNAELGAQEALFNTQSGNSYRWQKAMLEAENNPLGNLSKIAASYFADNSAYGRGYDTMHMAYPDAYTYKDPEATFYDKLFRNKSSKSGVKDRSLV